MLRAGRPGLLHTAGSATRASSRAGGTLSTADDGVRAHLDCLNRLHNDGLLSDTEFAAARSRMREP